MFNFSRLPQEAAEKTHRPLGRLVGVGVGRLQRLENLRDLKPPGRLRDTKGLGVMAQKVSPWGPQLFLHFDEYCRAFLGYLGSFFLNQWGFLGSVFEPQPCELRKPLGLRSEAPGLLHPSGDEPTAAQASQGPALFLLRLLWESFAGMFENLFPAMKPRGQKSYGCMMTNRSLQCSLYNVVGGFVRKLCDSLTIWRTVLIMSSQSQTLKASFW